MENRPRPRVAGHMGRAFPTYTFPVLVHWTAFQYITRTTFIRFKYVIPRDAGARCRAHGANQVSGTGRTSFDLNLPPIHIFSGSFVSPYISPVNIADYSLLLSAFGEIPCIPTERIQDCRNRVVPYVYLCVGIPAPITACTPDAHIGNVVHTLKIDIPPAWICVLCLYRRRQIIVNRMCPRKGIVII